MMRWHSIIYWPWDKGGDDSKDQHGHTAAPYCHLPTIFIRHQTRAEWPKSKPGEEQQLGQSFEPRFLTDQVPFCNHGCLPEFMIKLIIHTSRNTVAQQFLVLSHIARIHINSFIAIWNTPGWSYLRSSLIQCLSTPELLLGSYETCVENMSKTFENDQMFEKLQTYTAYYYLEQRQRIQ